MVQNLRFTGTELSSALSNVATSYTDTNPYKINNGNGWVDLTEGNSYDEARIHVATDDQVPSGATYTAKDIGVWYNYAAASAGTITGSNNSSAQVYDVCPKGWKLPNNPEYNGIISHSSLFSPITGGGYAGGAIIPGDEEKNGYWWSATLYDSSNRFNIYWYNGQLLFGHSGLARQNGFYVRCIRLV